MDIIDILDSKVKDTNKEKNELKERIKSLEYEITMYKENVKTLETKNSFYKDELTLVLSELDEIVKNIDV
ncbi:hypothetical protein CL660_002135 [bacterium]|nr:hypothetical protein [bacterium]